MPITISKEEARRLVVQSQQLFAKPSHNNALGTTLSAIEHLGYIQIDTISVVQRAHHHTLWNRNSDYNLLHIEELVAQKKVFEYWSHAAAFLPMKDFRYYQYRKQAFHMGHEKHWFKKDIQLMDNILKRIADEGPLMAKDFQHSQKVNEWGSKPAKQALENLYMQGDLMVAERKNFHKVYDLAERVLPKGINTAIPTQQEYIRFLITNYLRANAMGTASEVAYLLKKTKTLVAVELKEMLYNQEIVEVQVDNERYYVLPQLLNGNENEEVSNAVKILSPFDNLLIQRKRMKSLFDFDYQIECYTTEAKRKYGYFSLPILWKNQFVGRMDCKADHKTGILHINHLAFENHFSLSDAFTFAFDKTLKDFCRFNKCSSAHLHKTTPTSLKKAMKAIS